MNGILKGCSTMLRQVSGAAADINVALVDLQLNENMEEVRSKTLIVVMFSKILCNLNSLVLWQFGRAGDVQQQPSQLGKWRFFIAAAGTVIVAAALSSSTIITAVVVVAIICVTQSARHSLMYTSRCPVATMRRVAQERILNT